MQYLRAQVRNERARSQTTHNEWAERQACTKHPNTELFNRSICSFTLIRMERHHCVPAKGWSHYSVYNDNPPNVHANCWLAYRTSVALVMHEKCHLHWFLCEVNWSGERFLVIGIIWTFFIGKGIRRTHLRSTSIVKCMTIDSYRKIVGSSLFGLFIIIFYNSISADWNVSPWAFIN